MLRYNVTIKDSAMMLRRRKRDEDPAASAAREAVRAWCREALGGDEAIGFTISEIACNDAACGGVETIVLVMRPGRRTEAVKLRGPITGVTWPDILDAFSRRPDLWP